MNNNLSDRYFLQIVMTDFDLSEGSHQMTSYSDMYNTNLFIQTLQQI
jgi:hypothetical protein